MEYILMKKLIPSDIARDLQEYLYDDELTLEFHKFLHREQYQFVMLQLEHMKIQYNTEFQILEDCNERYINIPVCVYLAFHEFAFDTVLCWWH
jgi:hypothetical protein